MKMYADRERARKYEWLAASMDDEAEFHRIAERNR
jgi:hypothetical protein